MSQATLAGPRKQAPDIGALLDGRQSISTKKLP